MKAFSAAALGDAAGEQVDAELARPAAGGGQAGAVERLGAGQQLLAAGQQVPLLRQRDELGAVGRGGPHQALGGVEVAGLVAVELSCIAAARNVPLVSGIVAAG